MTHANCAPPLIYTHPGYKHLPYQKFENDIFVVDKCDLGLGMFAKRDIAQGEVVLTFEGPLIDFDETKTKGVWECMPIQIGANSYIDTLPPGVYVNHSCEPNAGIIRDRDLAALIAISKGEEIRFDYSTTMDEDSFTMECRCGHAECRGIIADFRTLSSSKRDIYLARNIVMSFIERKYDAIVC